MSDNLDDLKAIKPKSNAKFWGCIGCSFLIVMIIGFIIYMIPALMLWRAFTLGDIDNKNNSQRNITMMINDPTKEGVKINKHNDSSVTVSWDLRSDQMQEIKWASTKDIERLARSFYTENNYDKCIIKKQEYGIGYSVTFYKKEKLIYTVEITGN